MPEGIVLMYSSDEAIADKKTLAQGITTFVNSTWRDFQLTNHSSFKSVAKFGAGVLIGQKVSQEMGVFTPMKWVAKKFAPLPMEFTKSGAIQVFEFTTRERIKQVAIGAAAKIVLVTVAWEGGVLVGSMINQVIPEDTKETIGGTINEIINESGWKELWKHPFGIGM
jgi:hypothetical protein